MIIDNTVYDILSAIGFEDFGNKLKEQDLKFEKAVNTINNAYDYLSSFPEDPDYKKYATAFLLRVVVYLRKGRPLSSLSSEEWASILGDAKAVAFEIDPSRYSAFVFTCWAVEIEHIKNKLRGDATERIIGEIENNLATLKVTIDDYNEGNLGEVKFIESSLELCMQAVVLILTAYAGKITPDWAKDLVDSIGIFTFEIGRYKYYAKEHALLLEWEAHRNALTESLREEFDAYYAALRSNIDSILSLMDKALSDDPAVAFEGSAELAEAFGMEGEVLKTLEDIDDFFL